MSSTSENVDRFSSLPEEVLSHILSLLPTKLAVRTSILSKTWRYKWTHVHSLRFDDIHPRQGLDCLTKFVDRVLGLCRTSQIQFFRLYFSEIWVRRSSVSKWISEAVRLKVRDLVVDVIMLELPSCLFTCKTLTKLKISNSSFDLNEWSCPSSVHLPCLKTLNLRVFSNGSMNALKLIHGCPVLETLSLEITWPSHQEEFTLHIPSLKKLKLTTPKDVHKIVLNLPNLESLFLRGRLCPNFVMEDLQSLIEVTVEYYDVELSDLWTELLKGISRAKSFKWNRFTNITLNSPLPKFPNLKHLELKGSFEWILIPEILERSPELEYLCFQKPLESCWVEPASIPSCMVTNLRTMTFSNCKGWRGEMQFLAFMLGHTKVLKTLTVTCDRWREAQFRSQLLKFPRASEYCEVRFDSYDLCKEDHVLILV